MLVAAAVRRRTQPTLRTISPAYAGGYEFSPTHVGGYRATHFADSNPAIRPAGKLGLAQACRPTKPNLRRLHSPTAGGSGLGPRGGQQQPV